MLRADIIKITDNALEVINAGIGLVNGQLQCVEGNKVLVDDILSNPIPAKGGLVLSAQANPVEFLNALEDSYRGQRYYATAPYEDLDENYNSLGMFIEESESVPDGLELAFRPTGEGGGGSGSGYTVVNARQAKKLNIAKAAGMLEERGFKIGNPKTDLKAKATTYEISKGKFSARVDTKTIQAFLQADTDNFELFLEEWKS